MTANEIIAVINHALKTDRRIQADVSKDARLGANTIRHFRKTKNIRLDTLLMLCEELGIEVVVREKEGEEE